MTDQRLKLLSVHELAELTRRTVGSIYSERYRGEGLEALGVRVGRRLLWRLEDVEAWFEDELAKQRDRIAASTPPPRDATEAGHGQ